MKSRIVWFMAGSAAGLYASVKARRAAYRLSTPGLVDQAAALGVGWRAFSAELHDGMADRERDIARQLTRTHDHDDLLRLDGERASNHPPIKDNT